MEVLDILLSYQTLLLCERDWDRNWVRSRRSCATASAAFINHSLPSNKVGSNPKRYQTVLVIQLQHASTIALSHGCICAEIQTAVPVYQNSTAIYHEIARRDPKPSKLIFYSDRLLHARIQVHHDIHRRDQDLRRDQHDDDPLERLAVRRAHLVLQHREQVGQHVEALVEELRARVHLEVGAHRGVDGAEARLGPEQLGRVEHGALQVDRDAQNEELADLAVDGGARAREGAVGGGGGGVGRGAGDGGGEEVFEEGGLRARLVCLRLEEKGRVTCLDTLRQGMADR